MIMLDNTVVNVALPAIQRDLAADLSELQWVVTGYALTFAALMLIGGKVADAYGRRRIFVLGIVVFTLASLWCGLADSGEMLIAARVVQGAGAALMNPATLSIIAAAFPPQQRGTAIGIWAGVSALALAIGPLTGGLITDHLDWSWIFFVNVPIGVLAIAASYLFIDESRDETHVRLDLPGLAASSVGLFALTYALIEANTYGWGSTRILGSFAVAGVALVGFVLLERYQRDPMLPLELFRNGTYTGANLVILLVALAMFGIFFFLSLYMQNVLGYSAVQTGAAFLPMTILIILVAPIAGRMSDRIGSRGLMTAGMVLIAAQLLYFSRLGPRRDLLEPAAGIPDRRDRHVADDDAERRGGYPKRVGGQGRVGSAVLNASRQVGGSMGIAIMGAIVAQRAGGERTPEAFLDGFQSALLVAAAVAALGAVVAFALVRPHAGAGSRPARALRRGAGRMTTPASTRLPAAERRRAIVEAALKVFSEGSYAGATTAQIAREAGVSEPILYRHFASKRDLYVACLDEAWTRVRTRLEAEFEQRGAAEGWQAIGPATLREMKVLVPSLWMQAITEAGEDAEIRRYVRGHMREVHDFFADVIRRVQAEGGVHPDRNAEAEAWIFVAGSLLVSIADRLGGPLSAEDFAAIKAERMRWLTGES